MLRLIRALSILNAALWFGGALFFTAVVGPAVFSSEVGTFLPRPQAGRLALILIERYFIVQYVCGSVALLCLLADWIWSGRIFPAGRALLVAGLLSFALLGGFAVQPRMRQWHTEAYRQTPMSSEGAAALQRFRKIHGVTQASNLVLMAGMLWHLLLVSAPLRRPGPEGELVEEGR